ncbi:MAG: hypothetical protein H0V17_17265 [Deltaproteobacteria bacterium]|nr:hypothetical protein [Deltaproteobacteria bacterium]
MSQLLLFFVLQLLGSSACLAVGPQRELPLCMALGFLVGLAIAVFLSLPLLLLGQFTAGSVITVLALALVASIGVAVRRRRLTAVTVVRLLVWAIGFTALCLPFCIWNVSVMTYDSRVFVEYAEALQDMQQLTLETLSYLHSWGSFQIVAHSLAVVTWESHLYALAPAFSISLFATIAVTLYRGLAALSVPPRGRVIAIAIVLAVMLAVPLVRLHVVYIHANWACAGYLFVFAALFWLADLTDDAAYLPAAFLGFLAFAFARVESSLFVAVLLPLMLSQTRLSRRAVLGPYLGFTLVLAAWLLLLAAVVPDDSEYLTTTKSRLMAAAVIGIFLAFLVCETALGRRLRPLVPPLVAIACVVVIAVAVVTRFEVFRVSFAIWQHGLWLGSFWGFFLWPLVVVLAVLSLRLAAPPFSRPLRYGIAMFFAVIVLLTTLGADYGAGRFGSLTRVTLQIVPVIGFYFALAFTPAWCRWLERSKARRLSRSVEP